MRRAGSVFGSAILIVLGASAVGLIANAAAPKGIPLVTPPLPKAAKAIAFEEAAAAFDEHKAVFVDARPRVEYETGHIQGALLLPWEEREKYLPSIEKRIPKDQPVIVYCDESESCDLSKKVSGYLLQHGWKHVTYYRDGYNSWVNERSMPVSEGAAP
ncbi:MAG: rhodanese-like domain-containing protein [Armatimonadetes bacterium]|nr:rhodanese-like domain-containing protein [Armatimonadota bacterium]